MDRFPLSSGLLAVLLAFMSVLQASPADCGEGSARKHIVTVVSYDKSPFYEALSGIKQVLAEKGVAAEYVTVNLDGDENREAEIGRALSRSPDIIVCLGTRALEIEKVHRAGVPLVYGMTLKPEDNLNENVVAGVSLEFPLEIELAKLKAFLPEAQRVGVLYNPEENGDKIRKATGIAEKLGLELIAVPVQSPLELPYALEQVVKKAEVLWGISDRIVLSPKTSKNILLYSFRNRIPFIGLSHAWVKAGALYALDRDYNDIGVQCGEIVYDVLAGRKMKDREENVAPRKIRYVLNMKTVDYMKVEIPASLRDAALRIY